MKNETIAHSKSVRKDELRLLKLLNSKPTLKVEKQSAFYSFTNMCENIEKAKSYRFKSCVVEWLIKSGHISQQENQMVLEQIGKAYLKRLLFPENPFVAQNSDIEKQTLRIKESHHTVSKNIAESPLSRLHFRKDKTGNSWLNFREFQAGEKIRQDFERARLQPRVSANWEASVANSGRGNSSADLSDFAIDCRARLDAAIKVLGPELNGIVLDVCCYLKGLETVEKEKGWPPRSAKLLLRTALSILVRHYGIGQTNAKPSRTSWGGEGFRPSL